VSTELTQTKNLVPLPFSVTHAAWCPGDSLNADDQWKSNCPACMYRFGLRHGVWAGRGGHTLRDGTRIIADERGDIEIDTSDQREEPA
jgi:hypothetical protein